MNISKTNRMNGKKRPAGRQLKKRKYKAVLFDKDGVLIDSIDICLRAANEALKHFGKGEMSKEDFRTKFWGTRADLNVTKVFEGASESKVKEIYDYYNSKKLEFKDMIKLYPNTIAVLETLKNKGTYRLGVVTSSLKDVSEEILRSLSISKYFEVVIGGKDTKPKPAPDPILEACKRLGVEPKDTIFVGDTIPDIEASKAAGCDMVMLTTSLSREELKNVNGIEDVIIIDDLKEILQIL